MLEYDKIDLPERIDVNNTDGSCECIICHNWYFLEINFRFHLKVCNIYHDLIQKAMSLNDSAIVCVKENVYRIHFWYMSNNEAIYLLRNADLIEEK